jgi:glutamate 5-kinase
MFFGSGSDPEVLKKIMQGDAVGTLFHRDATQWHKASSRCVEEECGRKRSGFIHHQRCKDMANHGRANVY